MAQPIDDAPASGGSVASGAEKQPGGEQQRVAGQEEADHEAGLGEDDGEEAEGAEGADQLLGIEAERGERREQAHRDRLVGARCRPSAADPPVEPT